MSHHVVNILLNKEGYAVSSLVVVTAVDQTWREETESHAVLGPVVFRTDCIKPSESNSQSNIIHMFSFVAKGLIARCVFADSHAALAVRGLRSWCWLHSALSFLHGRPADGWKRLMLAPLGRKLHIVSRVVVVSYPTFGCVIDCLCLIVHITRAKVENQWHTRKDSNGSSGLGVALEGLNRRCLPLYAWLIVYSKHATNVLWCGTHMIVSLINELTRGLEL